MWGETGYGYGHRPGIFGNILRGLDAVVNVAQAYQGYQARKQQIEGGEREAALTPLKLKQALRPGEITEITPEEGQRIEKSYKTTLPRLTPEMVAKGQEGLFQRVYSGAEAPGDITTEEGGRATPMAEARRRQAEGEGLAARMGPIGGYAPITPEPTRVGIIGKGGKIDVKELPPGVKKIMADPYAKTPEHGIYDAARNVWIPTPGRAAILKPYKPQKGQLVTLDDGSFAELMPDGKIRKLPKGVTPLQSIEKGGEYNHLINLHKKVRPEQPITEESLQDLFGKFSKSGLNLDNQIDRDAYKSAISILSKNINFRDMDPNDPEYDNMLQKEVVRQKALVRGEITTQPSANVTIRNTVTGETKTMSRKEAIAQGLIK